MLKILRNNPQKSEFQMNLFIEAENYRLLVGSAEVLTNPDGSGKVICSKGNKDLWAYTEYQISTRSASTYYVWVRVTGKNRDKNAVYVSFNNLNDEKKIYWHI